MGHRWRKGELHGVGQRCSEAEFVALLDDLLATIEAAEAGLAALVGAYPLDVTLLGAIVRCEAYLGASRAALTSARAELAAWVASGPGNAMHFDA